MISSIHCTDCALTEDELVIEGYGNFRRSIICPAEAGADISGQPNPENLRGLSVASRLRAVTSSAAEDAASYRFVPEDSLSDALRVGDGSPPDDLQGAEPLLRAFLDQLAETLGQFQPVEKAFAKAHRLAGSSGDPDEDWEMLANFVFAKVAQGFLRVAVES